MSFCVVIFFADLFLKENFFLGITSHVTCSTICLRSRIYGFEAWSVGMRVSCLTNAGECGFNGAFGIGETRRKELVEFDSESGLRGKQDWCRFERRSIIAARFRWRAESRILGKRLRPPPPQRRVSGDDRLLP
ncbi:hypothetical protein HAX54_021290 [Datura stramonium]|uniref:Uncharacterized protein n=1 Tax=Datura stramonium TaxID=4076 RepID=A0ABS8UUD9_DATST|nr:hypothetical protein [Datura stramonium]